MSETAESQARANARLFRRGIVAAVALLVALVFWWFLEAGVSASRILFATLATSPLWLITPQLAAGARRSYAWLTLIVIPYFVLAITEAVANPHARGWAAACLFVGFTLFVMSIAYLRMTRPTATS